ncbi:MAG: sulfotransferase [Nitrospirota bacterium]
MTKVTDNYRKNADHELFLNKLNAALVRMENHYISEQPDSALPVVFICGAPRCGTTLMTQILARSDCFGYIDNFVARFWRAPFVGLILEKILGLRNLPHEGMKTFVSDFGRTPGILDPHEFTYFWEYWLKPDIEHHLLPADHMKKIDVQGLRKTINAIESLFRQPVFFKNIWFMSNPRLAHLLFPTAYIIVMQRDILSNSLSILNARKRYCGDPREWFSVRPPDYQFLMTKSPEMQIIGQITKINAEIARQTKDFPEKIIQVTYENLCKNPVKTFMEIVSRIGIQDKNLSFVKQKLQGAFPVKKARCSPVTEKKFREALKKYSG